MIKMMPMISREACKRRKTSKLLLQNTIQVHKTRIGVEFEQYLIENDDDDNKCLNICIST